jgi:beta-glucanase (GH16 family)
MITTSRNTGFIGFIMLLIVLVCAFGSNAQTRRLAWADEFNGPEIDRTVWKFGTGTTNDNIHFYTDRSENARIVDGKLRIIARKEAYRGSNYTSAFLETGTAVNWRYGRIEARIKLPGTPGFVPAFWMLPADNTFGWWPQSGEVDIMEYPTTQGTSVFGTAHTKAYNLFSSEPPRGGSVRVPDAESNFHLYAVEWTEEKIDFFVDDQKYFTFGNDHRGFETWPFDQPFYIILDLAVGGGWVGAPDERTVFPAVMEIDYVRVYQLEKDMAVNGPDFLTYDSRSVSYTFPDISGAVYSWNLPGHAEILAGQNTSRISTGWNIFGGTIKARIQTDKGSYNVGYPVEVSDNLLKNSGFEKGVKYWNGSVAFPAAADMRPDTLDVHRGKSSLRISVKTPGPNAWDVQVSQPDLSIEHGKRYTAGFWAKTDGNQGQLNAAIINSTDYTLYATKTFSVTDSWTRFILEFTANASAAVGFNVDLGSTGGVYHLDDFVFTTLELSEYNQVTNADFERSDEDWVLNSFFPVKASGSFQNGECAVTIDNGGVNAWDVHLGQTGKSIEFGREYTVSFDAYAAESRTISAIIGRNSDPWTVYSGDRVFSLTSAEQTYAFSFIMTEPSDLQARFGFDIGASTADVHFDNVFLSGGKTPSGVNQKADPSPDLFKLFQNYPNPFNPATTIRYRLAEAACVSLKIINGIGQEIVPLVDGFQRAGEYQIIWMADGLPSGIYFVRLKAGEFSETNKIVLQK